MKIRFHFFLALVCINALFSRVVYAVDPVCQTSHAKSELPFCSFVEKLTPECKNKLATAKKNGYNPCQNNFSQMSASCGPLVLATVISLVKFEGKQALFSTLGLGWMMYAAVEAINLDSQNCNKDKRKEIIDQYNIYVESNSIEFGMQTTPRDYYLVHEDDPNYLDRIPCNELNQQIMSKLKVFNAKLGVLVAKSSKKTIPFSEPFSLEKMFEELKIPFKCLNLSDQVVLICDGLNMAFATYQMKNIAGAIKNFSKVSPLSEDLIATYLKKQKLTAISNAEYRTLPSHSKPQKTTGTKEDPTKQNTPAERQDIELQNESAELMARNGYRVKYIEPRKGAGKNADLEIEGREFDVYSPRATTKPHNIAFTAVGKVNEGQSKRVIINLSRSQATPEQVSDELIKRSPVLNRFGGREVLVIDQNQNIIRVWPE